MRFYIRYQLHLEQLRLQVPLPEKIYFSSICNVKIGSRHIPLLCRDGVKTLKFCGQVTFVNCPKGQVDKSGVKKMFEEWLSNSTSIADLAIFNPGIYQPILDSVHRKPLLNSLRSLTLWHPRMNSKKLLLFGRAIKFAQHLHTITSLDLRDTVTSTSTTESILCVLYLNPNLKRLDVQVYNQDRFSTFRLALLHKLFSETSGGWPENSFCELCDALVVKHSFAELAKRDGNRAFHLAKTDVNLLTTKQKDYLCKRICSSFVSGHKLMTFTVK